MIKIMVDSSSDLKNDDNVFDLFVPISIDMDGKEYLDGVNIDSDTFYNLLLKSKGFPKTSQPSPSVFTEIFESAKAGNDEIIYFALSSSLSGTYQ